MQTVIDSVEYEPKIESWFQTKYSECNTVEVMDNLAKKNLILSVIEPYKAKWHGAKDMIIVFEEDPNGLYHASAQKSTGIISINVAVETEFDKIENLLVHEHFAHLWLHSYWGEKNRNFIYSLIQKTKGLNDFKEYYLNKCPKVIEYQINSISNKLHDLIKNFDGSEMTISQQLDFIIIDEYIAHFIEDHFDNILNQKSSALMRYLNEKAYGVNDLNHYLARPLFKYRYG